MNRPIRLRLEIRGARKLITFLMNTEFKQLAVALKTDIDAYDERQRETREETKRRAEYTTRQKAAKEACKLDGHIEPLEYDDHVKMIDGSSLEDVHVQIPSCSRCGESLVKLSDGTIKTWLAWTESKEPLHETMLVVRTLCEEKAVAQR